MLLRALDGDEEAAKAVRERQLSRMGQRRSGTASSHVLNQGVARQPAHRSHTRSTPNSRDTRSLLMRFNLSSHLDAESDDFMQLHYPMNSPTSSNRPSDCLLTWALSGGSVWVDGQQAVALMNCPTPRSPHGSASLLADMYHRLRHEDSLVTQLDRANAELELLKGEAEALKQVRDSLLERLVSLNSRPDATASLQEVAHPSAVVIPER